MSGVGVLQSHDPLFRRALLFSLAAHLATLAWVQTPVWETTPPPLVIAARLEPLSEPAVRPLSPTPNPTPTPVQKQAAPLPLPLPIPLPAPPPPAIVVPVPVPAPVAVPSPVATQSVSPLTRPLTQATVNPAALTAVSSPVVPAPAQLIPDGEWYAVRQLDTTPRRLGRAQPVYPESARKAGETGSLKVRLRVNALGEVEAVEIVSAQPEGVFDSTVRAFFLAARYQAPQREGRPVRAIIEERVSFILNDDF